MVEVPANKPVTIPVAFTVANELTEEAHVPPTVVDEKVTVAPPSQTESNPVIGDTTGGVVTVIGKVVNALPQVLTTV